MGTQAGFDPNVFGPFGAMFQNYFSALENFGRGGSSFGGSLPSAFDPQAVTSQMTAPLKVAARCQLEVLGLANRRAQAYMQMPTRLSQCKTPQDFATEQMAFWRTAAEQYTDSTRKIGEAWAQVFPWLNVPAGNFGARTERDYINFNGTGSKEPNSAPVQEPTGKQRRVA